MGINLPSLYFDDQLDNSNSIGTNSLPQRLMVLHNELQHLDQRHVDFSSLKTMAKGLLQPQLLHHQDVATSILVTCCIIEVLRLYSPNTPYDYGEIQVIFNAIISHIHNFGNNINNFEYHIYLLERLSTVEVIRIIAHLEQAENMTALVFGIFLDNVEKELPPMAHAYMIDILARLFEEIDVSPQMMELLLNNLINDNGETRNRQTVTMDLCRASHRSLQNWMLQYYINITVIARHLGEGQTTDLERLHGWIPKVYITMPSLLSKLIPRLQEELIVEEFGLRYLATETFGMMLANDPSTLFTDYPGVWELWLERCRDISIVVRTQWLELACLIYQHYPELTTADLNEKLVHVLVDPDESVRVSCCSSIGKMDIGIITGYIATKVLEQLSTRCRDKKIHVQEAAMISLGTIYCQVYSQMGNKEISNKFGWIPGELFRCLFPGDRGLDVLLDNVLQSHIFPKNMDDDARVDRLVTAFMYFSEKAKNAFDVYIARGKRHIEMMQRYMDFTGNKEMDSILTGRDQQRGIRRLARMIAVQFENYIQMFRYLGQIREIGDVDVLQLLQSSMDMKDDYKTIMEAQNSLLEVVEENIPGSLELCQCILNRTHLLVVNRSTLSCLYKMLKSTSGTQQPMDDEKRKVIVTLAKKFGFIFSEIDKSSIESLFELITNDNELSVNAGLEILVSITKLLPTKFMLTSQNIAQLWSYTVYGSLLQAEYTATILCNCNLQETNHDGLIEDLLTNLTHTNPNLATVLTSMSVMVRRYPLIAQQHLEIIVSFIEHECMNQTTYSSGDNNPEWAEYNDLEVVSKQKLAAMGILSNYLTGMAASKQNVGSDFLGTVVDTLEDLMEVTCDIATENGTSAAESSHLRVLAGITIVQLAEHSVYSSIMDIKLFEQLGLLLQDTCYYVRLEFGEFLMSGLSKGEISPLYQVLLVLCAFEPEKLLWTKVQQFLCGYATEKETGKSTTTFAIDRLIHLLAHHPDFTTFDEDLLVYSHYIDFWIKHMVTDKNITFFYHLIQQIKLSVDDFNENGSIGGSYFLCDLVCLLLSRAAERCDWEIGPIQPWIECDSQVYTPLLNYDIRKQMSETNFISQDLASKLKAENIWKNEKSRFEQTTSNNINEL